MCISLSFPPPLFDAPFLLLLIFSFPPLVLVLRKHYTVKGRDLKRGLPLSLLSLHHPLSFFQKFLSFSGCLLLSHSFPASHHPLYGQMRSSLTSCLAKKPAAASLVVRVWQRASERACRERRQAVGAVCLPACLSDVLRPLFFASGRPPAAQRVICRRGLVRVARGFPLQRDRHFVARLVSRAVPAPLCGSVCRRAWPAFPRKKVSRGADSWNRP